MITVIVLMKQKRIGSAIMFKPFFFLFKVIKLFFFFSCFKVNDKFNGKNGIYLTSIDDTNQYINQNINQNIENNGEYKNGFDGNKISYDNFVPGGNTIDGDNDVEKYYEINSVYAEI